MPSNKKSFLIVIAVFGCALSSCAVNQKSTVTAQTKNSAAPLKSVSPPVAGNSNAKPTTTKKTPDFAAPRPVIVSRADWQAKPSVGTANEQEITKITIHHTATGQKSETAIEKKMRNLQNFAQTSSKLATGKTKPAWFDVPYHFYIAFDGAIAEGREIKFVGDTNTDYDPSGHALVVLEGNFQIEKPSAEQIVALEKLTLWLSAEYQVAAADIKAHNDYAATACPGENLKSLLAPLREKVETTQKMSKVKKS